RCECRAAGHSHGKSRFASEIFIERDCDFLTFPRRDLAFDLDRLARSRKRSFEFASMRRSRLEAGHIEFHRRARNFHKLSIKLEARSAGKWTVKMPAPGGNRCGPAAARSRYGMNLNPLQCPRRYAYAVYNRPTFRWSLTNTSG